MLAWSTASVSAIFQVSSSCAAGMVKFNYFNSCKTKKNGQQQYVISIITMVGNVTMEM